MSKQRKKRNKRYSPDQSAMPTVHRYVAETEEKKQSRRKLTIRGVIIAIAGLLALLLGAWIL